MKRLSLEERWVERVDEPSDDNSCWIWNGSRSTQGYGKLRVEGKDLFSIIEKECIDLRVVCRVELMAFQILLHFSLIGKLSCQYLS